ncbi:MAG: GNAT family N-acetyltransferase [Nitrospinota bacterium]
MSAEPPLAVQVLTRYSEMVALEAVQRQVWRRPGPYTARMLHALGRTGGLILGGFVGEELVGFAIALFATDPAGPYLFSLATGVRRDHRGRGLGRRLKMAQRDHALARGLTRMRWTFDPLLARTAHFHCTALGAIGRAYEAAYFNSTEGREGPLMSSDRLQASWDLPSRRVEARLSGERPTPPEGTWVTRLVDEDGLPALAEVVLDRAEARLLVEVPPDLKPFRDRPDALAVWRRGIGRLLEKYVNGDGYAVTECFTTTGDEGRRSFYLLERPS